jgi:hypothetical protein
VRACAAAQTRRHYIEMNHAAPTIANIDGARLIYVYIYVCKPLPNMPARLRLANLSRWSELQNGCAPIGSKYEHFLSYFCSEVSTYSVLDCCALKFAIHRRLYYSPSRWARICSLELAFLYRACNVVHKNQWVSRQFVIWKLQVRFHTR